MRPKNAERTEGRCGGIAFQARSHVSRHAFLAVFHALQNIVGNRTAVAAVLRIRLLYRLFQPCPIQVNNLGIFHSALLLSSTLPDEKNFRPVARFSFFPVYHRQIVFGMV